MKPSMGLPPLKAERGRLPLVPVLVFLIPTALTFASFKYLQIHSLRPIAAEFATLQKQAKSAKDDNERQAAELARLERQVAALQAIQRVEIVWGGALSDTGHVTFPYQHDLGGKVFVRPGDSTATVWYYCDEGDTLQRIAAHPQVLGAAYLWPILASSNGLSIDATDPLPAGKLIKVPNRIGEYEIRSAITKAGAPDKARDAIFAVAGLKP
jgi:hypothetical protein